MRKPIVLSGENSHRKKKLNNKTPPWTPCSLAPSKNQNSSVNADSLQLGYAFFFPRLVQKPLICNAGFRETVWVGVWFGKTISVLGRSSFLHAEPRRRSELLHGVLDGGVGGRHRSLGPCERDGQGGGGRRRRAVVASINASINIKAQWERRSIRKQYLSTSVWTVHESGPSSSSHVHAHDM